MAGSNCRRAPGILRRVQQVVQQAAAASKCPASGLMQCFNSRKAGMHHELFDGWGIYLPA